MCIWFLPWQLVSRFWSSLQVNFQTLALVSINFIISYSWDSDRFSYPDPHALLLRRDFFPYAQVFHPPANIIDQALVIQHSFFYDVLLGTMFARVDAASLQLAVPAEVSSRSCSSQNICCFSMDLMNTWFFLFGCKAALTKSVFKFNIMLKQNVLWAFENPHLSATQGLKK